MRRNPNSSSLPDRIGRDLAGYGLRRAGGEDLADAHALVAGLIGGAVVSAVDFARVHRACDGAVYLAEEDGRLTGVLAFVLLSKVGHAAVLADAFEARCPHDDHLAHAGEGASAIYGWGVAATTREAARRLIEGARAMGRGAAAQLPYFARPTTEAGHRLMREKLGFVDLAGSRSGLVWAPPANDKVAAA